MLCGLLESLDGNCCLYDENTEACYDGASSCFDLDGDGVPDDEDSCLETTPGEKTDATGCSVNDLCRCYTGWKNHGHYVKCIKQTAKTFKRDGILTRSERQEISWAAAQSDCGRLEQDSDESEEEDSDESEEEGSD